MKRKLSGKFSHHKQAKQDDQRQPHPSQSRTFPISNLPSGAIRQNVTTSTAKSIPLQPKLTIGQAGDQYEQEADTVAAQVVQQINAPVQRQSEEKEPSSHAVPVEITAPAISMASLNPTTSQTDALFNATAQRATDPMGGQTASADFETALHQTQGKGQSLASNLQTKMGATMGADFSGLNIHTDNQSDALCKSIQAKAFTTGNDIYFGKDEYQPNTSEGQFLIAHEATHSMQQDAVDVQRKETVIQRLGLNDASAIMTGQGSTPPAAITTTQVGGPAAGPTQPSPYANAEEPAKRDVMKHLKKQPEWPTWDELRQQGVKEYCVENMEFLEWCEMYYRSPNIQLMDYIYKNYVATGSTNEINIASGTRQSCMAFMTTELSLSNDQRQVHPGIFDDAQNEIARLVREVGPRTLIRFSEERWQEFTRIQDIAEEFLF